MTNNATETNPRSGWDRLCVWLATCGGIGFSPWAPGTLGALLGLPLTVFLASTFSPTIHFLVVVGLFLVGIPICDRAARVIGREDPGSVIWDELVTVPCVFFLVPSAQLSSPWVLLTGFGLHRLFDITKIPPARQMEQFHGGAGIMLDDLVAGFYACACLHGILFFG